MKKYRWILLPILLCFSVWLLFHTVLFVGIVPSSSMEPTIPEDSIILGNRLIGNLGRGDIIVFRHGGKTLVKRIVAVGGDTVSLNGKHFTAHVKEGDQVRRGQLLLEFDMAAIRSAGFELTTPIIVSNYDEFRMELRPAGEVRPGNALITLYPRQD